MFSYFYRTQPLFRAVLKFVIAGVLWAAMQMILYGSIRFGIDVVIIGAFLLWYMVKGEVLVDDGYFIEYMLDSYSGLTDEELKKTFEPYGVYVRFEESTASGEHPFIPLHLSEGAQQCLVNNGIHDLDELLKTDDGKLKEMDINSEHYKEITAELTQYRKTHKDVNSDDAEEAGADSNDSAIKNSKSDASEIECSDKTGKFSSAYPELKKKIPEHCDAVIDYMQKHFHEGDMIEADVLCKACNLELMDAQKAMDACAEAGLIQEYYGIVCSDCGKYSGNSFSDIRDIPDDVVCEQCGQTIDNASSHRKIFYRVL